MTTSDSVHFGEGPAAPSAGASDYSWWRNSLTPEQGLIWGQITRGMSTRDRITLYEHTIKLPLARAGEAEGLIVIRNLKKIGEFQVNDRFVCRKWAARDGRRLVFSKEFGFCTLLTIFRGGE